MTSSVLLALVLSAAAGTAEATASSIVFIKQNDVWLANPDGSGQYQVTSDGSASSPYRSPSQADGGTIFAIKGTGTRATFHKMTQNGTLLAQPFESSAPGSGPLEASISPDGSRAAYSFLTTVDYSCYPYRCGSVEGRVFYTHSDRFTRSDEIQGPNTYGDDPSWIDNGRILFMNGSPTAWTDVVGPTEATQWFDDFDTPGSYGAKGQSYRDGEASSTTVALIRQNEGHIGEPPADGSTSIQLFNRNGGSSDFSTDPTPTCAIRKPGTGSAVPPMEDPTLAPDSGAVAWQEPDGIWSATTICPVTSARLIIPGGSEADWGPADVRPESRGQAGGGAGGGADTAAPNFAIAGRAPRLARALKRGIAMTFACDEACRLDAQLILGSGRRAKVVGRGRGTLSDAGEGRLVVKFTRAGKKALRNKKRVTLKLALKATDPSGNTSTDSVRVKLRR